MSTQTKKNLAPLFEALNLPTDSPFLAVASSYEAIRDKKKSDPDAGAELQRAFTAFMEISKVYFLNEHQKIQQMIVKSQSNPGLLMLDKAQPSADPEMTIEPLEASDRVQSNSHPKLLKLITSMIASRRAPEALSLLSQCRKHAPRDPLAWLLEASALKQMGRVPETKIALKRVLEIDPNHPTATKELRRLDEQSFGHLRKWKRAPVQMDAFVRLSDTDSLRRDRVVTLGGGGLCLDTCSRLRRGMQLSLVLVLESGRHVRVSGEVLYYEPTTSSNGRHRYGVRFTQIAENDQALIDQLVTSKAA